MAKKMKENEVLDAPGATAGRGLAPAPKQEEPEDEYTSLMKDVAGKIKEWEEARKTAREEDEIAKRRSRSMKMIAGISDGLAGLANLIGTAKGGTNIDMGTGSLTPLQQNLEKARLERKADIKSIDDRLEQYANQMRQMQVAKFGQEKEDERLQKTQEFTASEAQKTRDFEERIAKLKFKEEKEALTAKQQWEAYQNDLNRANNIEKANITARGTANNAYRRDNSEVMFYGTDNKQTTYIVPKATLAAINANAQMFVDKDLQDKTNTGLAKAYKDYQTAVATNNTITASDDVKRAWAKVLNASPTYRAEIEKYGTQKGKTTSWMDAYPDPEEE